MNVFSSEGKLHQIEYAFKAVKNCGRTSIGIRGKNSVVTITEKKISDKMVDTA